jgi:hypothetical protein
MRASFGTADGGERPHICYPLASTMDRLVATPVGQAPPELGGDLPERADELAARRRGAWAHGQFRPGFVYRCAAGARAAGASGGRAWGA